MLRPVLGFVGGWVGRRTRRGIWGSLGRKDLMPAAESRALYLVNGCVSIKHGCCLLLEEGHLAAAVHALAPHLSFSR